MKIKDNFKKIKLRWKLAIIFIAIPIIIWILANSNKNLSQAIKNSGLGDYLAYLYAFPITLVGPIIEQIPCDGLTCVIFIGIIWIVITIIFYGILGFLIGYSIEKIKKKNKKSRKNK